MSVLAQGDTVNRDLGPVTVVASFAVDHVHREGEPDVSLPGGPARFISETLASLGRQVAIITGIVADVNAFAGPEGEEYSIRRLPLIPLNGVLAGNVVVSPIMREIDAASVPAVTGFLAVDVQGFVRHPRDEPDLSPDSGLPELFARADVVKISEAELLSLTVRAREALDGTVALITRGAKGLDVQVGGVAHRIPVEAVTSSNAIGAGDILLAAYVDAALRDADPARAAESAAWYTSAALRRR